MVLIVVFDLFAKYIAILYVMMVLSNFTVFMVFVFLATDPDFSRGDTQHYKWVYLIFQVAYGVCLALAVYPGTSCATGSVYCKSLSW